MNGLNGPWRRAKKSTNRLARLPLKYNLEFQGHNIEFNQVLNEERLTDFDVYGKNREANR